MAKARKSVNTLTFQVLTDSSMVEKALWRVFVLWVLGYRESAQTLEWLRDGKHSSVLGNTKAAQLMQQMVTAVLTARSGSDEDTDGNGAVRNSAGKLFGPLVDPNSVALGIQNDPDSDARAEIFANPRLLGVEPHLSKIKGNTRRTKELFVGEPTKAGERPFYRCRLRPELVDLPYTEWPEDASAAFMKLVNKLYPESNDGGGPARQLRLLGVLGPKAPPVVRTIDEVALGGGTPKFSKGFFSAAATMLASHSTRRDQAVSINQDKDVKRQQVLDSIPGAHRAILERIEQELTAHFDASSKKASKRGFRIQPRAIKGFHKVRAAWLKATKDLPAVTREVQARMRHDFGSIPLFDMLANDWARPVWEGSDYAKTSLSRWIDYRNTTAHRMPTLTYPDPVEHPVWPEFGGDNALAMSNPKFHAYGEPGVVTLRLPDVEGHWHTMKIKLAWNQRYRLPHAGEEGRITLPGASDGTAFEYGGAKLVLDRSVLAKPKNPAKAARALDLVKAWEPAEYKSTGRDPNRLARVNEIVDLLHGAYDGMPTARLDASIKIDIRKHQLSDVDLQKALREYSKTRITNVSTLVGTRILSIDLGVRNAGGCAILHVEPEGTLTSKPFFDLDGARVIVEYAEAQYLPGDKEPKPNDEKRLEKYLSAGKRMLSLQSSLLQGLADRSEFKPVESEADLDAAFEPVSGEAKDLGVFRADYRRVLEATDRVEALRACEALNCKILKFGVRDAYRKLKARRGKKHVHEGRMRLLDDLLRYEHSYASRRYLGAKGNIVAGQKQGISNLPQILRLRANLTNLVLDRLQKCAGLYIRLALKHQVHVVAMEDLKGWKRHATQDKRVNRLLTKWCHPRISETLERALDRESILLRTVHPAWTSQIDAWGRPGVRCLVRQGWMKRAPEGARFGDLVPWRGGDIWVSLQNGALLQVPSEEVAAISIGKALLRAPAETVSSVEVFETDKGLIVNRPFHLEGLGFDPATGFGSRRQATDAMIEEFRKNTPTKVFLRDVSQDVLPSTEWSEVSPFLNQVDQQIMEVLRNSWGQKEAAE